VIITALILAVICAAGGAYVVGIKMQRAKQTAATEAARSKMAGVRDSNSDSTTNRMRDGDF